MKYTFARISALLQFSTFLSVLCASLGVYLLINTAMDYYQSQNKSLKASNIATHIESKFSQYQTQLRVIAMQPDIITVLQSDDEARRTKEASLKKEIPSALKLRLLPPDTNAVDTSEVPNLGYACLGMIRQSAKSPGPQSAEVHMLDTPSSHIAVIQSVWDQNNELAGYILLSLKPELIQEILNEHPHQEGYLELRQKLSNGESIKLVKHGKPVVNINNPPAEEVPVGHTNWMLSYWQDVEPWTLSSDMRPIFVYFGLSALFLLLGPLLVHNLMRRTVQDDIKTLTTMLNDIRTGKIAPDYPIKLKELSLIAIQLQRSGGKLVRDQQALIKEGHTDQLTGLADMTVFNLKLDQLFDHTKLGFPSTVMIVDIDHLLQINDKYEHEGGNRVLQEFAIVLNNTMRQVDYVCRLEEDKFGVIFSLTTLDDVAPAIERLKGIIPFRMNIFAGKTIEVSWSAGLSAMQASDQNAMAVIQRAESALRKSKKAGGNQISFSSAPAPKKASGTVSIESSQNNLGGQTHGSEEKGKTETKGKEKTDKEKSAKKEKTKLKVRKNKVTKKKRAKKKSARKKARKKIARKKVSKKKLKRKSKAKKKKTAKKKKPAAKKPAARKPAMPKPAPASAEPLPGEERVGIVTHYYSHLSVAVIKMESGILREGDWIHIRGHTSDFRQRVESMEIDYIHVPMATPGQSFGLKVVDHAREHDVVYKVASSGL